MARLHQAGQRLEHLQEAPDDHGTERIKTLEAANRKLTQAVAERRDAEQELLHYKYLLGALRDGFYFVDTDYIYREVNERYLDFVGKRREQLLGKRINEVLEEDFFQRQIKPLFDHCAVEGGLHTQQWVEYPGTDRRYLDVRCNPAYDEAHGLVGYIVLARDITDLKRMEERLRMYESILAQVSERISVIGTDYHYRFVNQRNWDFYGKHPEELVGRHLSDLIGGETFQMRTKAYLDQCFQGAMVNYQAPMPAKGVMRDFDVNMAPYRETDGSIAGAVVTIRDITERKRIEQALATERNLLRSLIDNIPDYIFAKDKDSRYIVKNLAGARLLGAAHPDEVIGKSDLDYYPAEFAVQYRADDQFVIQRGEALVAKEEINANPGGDRKLWVLTTKVPLRDAAGNITGLVGMTRDITEQKQIAIALKHSEERFRDFA
ncbi:MAG: PAS domain-containing protein, partial [Gammaproteobacteria bacterium]